MSEDRPIGDPVRLLGMLSAQERLRVFAAVVLGSRTSEEVSRGAGLPAKTALQALTQLQREALVEHDSTGWKPRVATLRDAVAAAAQEPGKDEDHPTGAADAAVFRAFMRGGRLVAVPAQRGKRLVILEHLSRAFEPGQYYSEREVTAILRAFHHDYAMLRRYLVDEGFLTREAGTYWRTGGQVEV